jgi:DnaK suppressor protein
MENKKRKRTPHRPAASTQEILGPQGAKDSVPFKWRKHYRRLLNLLEAVRTQQDRLVKDALQEQPTFSTHMADAGTDTYDRDLALGVLSSEQDALYQIEQSLDRIRNGSYGICELTGKPIEPKRLEAIPWTRFCMSASRALDRDGAIKRAHLGQRDTVVKAEAESHATAKAEDIP